MPFTGNRKMKTIENQSFDTERALYGEKNIHIVRCTFDGPADGESACKECTDITAEDCSFCLRYPFWHNNRLMLRRCEMTEGCRAALWYCDDVAMEDTKLHGIKALRECRNVHMQGCDIVSPEFGWSVVGISMEQCAAESEYFFLRGLDLHFDHVELRGKYAFQYIKNATFENCIFQTKDAFWHGENITVKNSVIRGEYLAWYSDGLTLINCKITGTQPFCYCKNLTLIDCEMYNTDLAFEKSSVQAVITTPIVSIKNPYGGKITAPAVGEVIRDDPQAVGEVLIL